MFAANDSWTTLVVRVSEDRAEVIADRLWDFDPSAIEERTAPDGSVVLATGFASAITAAVAGAAVRELGAEVTHLVPVVDDGRDGWRAWARVERAGPFAVVPAWLDAPSDVSDDRVLRIDPGHTFGSGSHPTTRLVLARLATVVEPGMRVLDVGTGSGVLAIAAARLGASTVRAIDIDPDSPSVVGANAAANGVAAQIQGSCVPLAEVVDEVRQQGGFDLVLANLLAPVIRELADDLLDAGGSGGTLILSGLLADRWHEATASLTRRDAAVVAADEGDGWAAVTLRCPGAAPPFGDGSQ